MTGAPGKTSGTVPPEVLLKHWQSVRSELKGEYGEAAFNSWLKPVEFVSYRDGRVLLSAPTRFMRDWVRSHYADRMTELWHQAMSQAQSVEIHVAPRGAPTISAPVRRTPQAGAGSSSAETAARCRQEGQRIRRALGRALHLRELHRRQVERAGPCGAPAVWRKAATVKFNPLFLYGGVGLGKTHLMHAIAWHIREKSPDRKVIYMSAEKFMYQFIRALRYKDTMAFKQQFRSVDVLMIDDVQFIAHKDTTQEEFFHTFNALVDHNRQVIISADRSPSDLEGIEERIKSRLGWGLVADIHPTDYELRLGILQSKAERADADVPERVLEFLAHRITSNVRELEGALNRVTAYASLDRPAGHHGDDPGGPDRPVAGQRPARLDRGYPAPRRRLFQSPALRHVVGAPLPRGRPAASDRHVSGQAADHPFAARDRPQIRRPRSHDGHARRQADQRIAPDRLLAGGRSPAPEPDARRLSSEGAFPATFSCIEKRAAEGRIC